MKAMLLAAGEGRRMLPWTLTEPKPAIPVLGRPLIVQILQWLGRHGVEEVVINLHHRPERMRALLGEGNCPGLPVVHYSHESEELLGTAGGLRKAAPMLRGGEPIVICNSDFLADIDLSRAVDEHLTSGNLATLVLTDPRRGYSIVKRTKVGQVVSLAGQPPTDGRTIADEHLFTGCHVIEESVLDRIPESGPSDIVRDVYRSLAADGSLGSFLHDGFWWEFGTPTLYLEGSLLLLGCPPDRLRRITLEHDGIRAIGSAAVAVGPGVDFSESTRFVGRSALGYASHIGDETVIEDSVIMPEAWIGPNCRLRRAIIAHGVELPAGFESDGEFICVDVDPTLELPPGTRRENGMLLHSFGATGG